MLFSSIRDFGVQFLLWVFYFFYYFPSIFFCFITLRHCPQALSFSCMHMPFYIRNPLFFTIFQRLFCLFPHSSFYPIKNPFFPLSRPGQFAITPFPLAPPYLTKYINAIFTFRSTLLVGYPKLVPLGRRPSIWLDIFYRVFYFWDIKRFRPSFSIFPSFLVLLFWIFNFFRLLGLFQIFL